MSINTLRLCILCQAAEKEWREVFLIMNVGLSPTLILVANSKITLELWGRKLRITLHFTIRHQYHIKCACLLFREGSIYRESTLTSWMLLLGALVSVMSGTSVLTRRLAKARQNSLWREQTKKRPLL